MARFEVSQFDSATWVVLDNQTGIQVAECCELDRHPIPARERAQMIAGYFNTVCDAGAVAPGSAPPGEGANGETRDGGRSLAALPPDEEYVVRQLSPDTWAVVDLLIWQTVCTCTREGGYGPTPEERARLIAAALNLLRRDPNLLG